MKAVILFLLVALTFSAAAENVKLKVTSRIKSEMFELGVGSEVELQFVEKNQIKKMIFLGRMAGHPDLGEEILFLDIRSNKVLFIDSKNVKTSIAKKRMQTLISTIDQAGETCVAYALFHFWQQIYETGFKVNKDLKLTMGSERGRMKFLEESLTRYYMGRSVNLRNTMKVYGERFGFKCKESTFKEQVKAIDYVYTQALNAKPVVMEFYIGPDMVESPYELLDYETNIEMDPRLWIPRKIGQRKSSGHAIVAAAAFTLKGKKKVLVLDSNWTEPRVWDLEKYLGGKTAIADMIFHTCN